MLGGYRYQSIRTGLVGHWRPSRGPTGNTLIDSVNKNHGVLTFNPLWQASGDGLSLRFDGTNKYVAINGLFRRLQDHVTVSIWFRNTGNYTGYAALYDAGAVGNPVSRQLSCFLGGSNAQLYVALKGSGGAFLNLSNTLELDRWTQLALTFDGATITAYVDGIARGTVTSGFGASFTEHEMRVGANPTGGGTFFNGFQDDFAVFSKALNPSEVLTLYTAGRGALDQRVNVTVVRGATTSTGTGSASITEANDTVSSTATIAIAAAASIAELSDTVSSVSAIALRATAGITESSDTLASASTIALRATLAVTEASDTCVGASTITSGITGTTGATEADDTLSSASTIALRATAGITEANDTVTSTSTLLLRAVLAVTEASDSLSSASTISDVGLPPQIDGSPYAAWYVQNTEAW